LQKSKEEASHIAADLGSYMEQKTVAYEDMAIGHPHDHDNCVRPCDPSLVPPSDQDIFRHAAPPI
jgi:hypothetical protein